MVWGLPVTSLVSEVDFSLPLVKAVKPTLLNKSCPNKKNNATLLYQFTSYQFICGLYYLNCKGQDGLELSGEGRQRPDMGDVLISDITGNPHTTCTWL